MRHARGRRRLTRRQQRDLRDALPEVAEYAPPGRRSETNGGDAAGLATWFFTGWSERQIQLQTSFLAFDRLPWPIKRQIHQLAITFDPREIADYLQKARVLGDWRDEDSADPAPRATHTTLIDHVCQALSAAERADLQSFGAAYFQRWGTVLPHRAARVRVQRDVRVR